MARRLDWTQLHTGIIATAAVIGAALFILVYGRVGRMRGDKFDLFVVTDAARGVNRGSEVWLNGQKVGLVQGVSFRPPTSAAKERLLISLRILDDDRTRIRLDSKVQIRPGLNIIGDRVVYLNGGSLRARPVVDGDTLRAAAQGDMEELSSEAALASREFPGIIENVKLLTAGLKTAEGTLGAFGMDSSNPDMRRILARSRRLMARVGDSTGSLGRALGAGARSDLATRAQGAMARADSIRTLLSSDLHSLGRFRRDSTIVRDIERIRAELADIRRLAAEPGGTVGRVRGDSAIARAIQRGMIAIDSLRNDIKKHPLRYIAF